MPFDGDLEQPGANLLPTYVTLTLTSSYLKLYDLPVGDIMQPHAISLDLKQLH